VDIVDPRRPNGIGPRTDRPVWATTEEAADEKGKGPLEGPFSTFVESVSLSSASTKRLSVGSSWSLLFEASS
jgi:hypothetical protein